MPYSYYLSSELSNLATTLASVSNGSDIYISKNSLGVVSAYNVERATTLSNFGYSFQHISGDVSYTTLPITNLNQIPWTYPYTVLTASSANLWNSSLMLWLDSFETKRINASLQKIVSKDYTNNLVIVENTDNNSFLYTSPSLSLTSNSSLESSTVQTVYPYFKLAMVFTLGTQTLNTVLFQHNRLKIKITSQIAADGTTQNMIGIFDNDVFKKGIMLNSSNLGFKYQLYTDNIGTLVISGNTSLLNGAPAYYQATTAKIYVGSDSTKNYPSNMVLHELLLFESVANDIVATSANIDTYFTTRHILTTYTDTSNISPFTDPYNAYLATGSLRLFTGDYGNTDGVSWHTFNGVLNSGDTNRLSGQCGPSNNVGGCLKCISLANTQYVSGFSSITSIIPLTVVVLVRWTANGGLTVFKLGTTYGTNLWLFDVLATSGNMRINPTQGPGYYCDYDSGMALNTWYIITYKYSGGLLSTAQLRINGSLKSVIESSGGTPSGALTNVLTLPQSSGGTMFYGGLYLNNTAMTNATIEKVEGFFAHRMFGNGSMLVATHPYYSSPPTF